MNVRSVYLDTNAIVKRYAVEERTERLDGLYDRAHVGQLIMGFSACVDEDVRLTLSL